MVGRRLTTTEDLLRQCGYMSIRQMAYYYSVALAHKVLLNQAPVHLHQILRRALTSGVQHQHDTRTAGTRTVAPARLAPQTAAGGGGLRPTMRRCRRR